MHGLVLVINHSIFLDLRFGTASQKTSGRHTLLVVSRKDLSHIYIHLNDSVFGIFIDSFLFWRFDHFGKAPYKKLFVCMYVCILENYFMHRLPNCFSDTCTKKKPKSLKTI